MRRCRAVDANLPLVHCAAPVWVRTPRLGFRAQHIRDSHYMEKIPIALVGVGNCAGSRVQGIHYHRGRTPEPAVGLMHPRIGRYGAVDIGVAARAIAIPASMVYPRRVNYNCFTHFESQETDMHAGKSRTVVITGASAGVGRATAIAFARRGWRVGLIARGEVDLEGARAEVERAGAQAVALPADVANAQEVEAAAGEAEQALGPIDVWVNGAMVTELAPFMEMTPEEFRRITEVTYLGQVHGTMAALKRMVPRDHGTIVQIGSALAYRSIPLQSAYCGAKHAVRGFTDSIRSELLHDRSRVRITMVQLPGVNTPQFTWARNRLDHQPQPVPPFYRPETAAAAVLRAAEKAPRELWVGAPALQVILGSMFMPGWLDRMLARQGYSGQQTDEPAEARPDNLERPVPELAAVSGPYDARARRSALRMSAGTVRGVLWSGALGAALASYLLGYAGGSRHERRQRPRLAPRARRVLARAQQRLR